MVLFNYAAQSPQVLSASIYDYFLKIYKRERKEQDYFRGIKRYEPISLIVLGHTNELI